MAFAVENDLSITGLSQQTKGDRGVVDAMSAVPVLAVLSLAAGLLHATVVGSHRRSRRGGRACSSGSRSSR